MPIKIKIQVVKGADEMINEWKKKHFAPVKRDENWEVLKWHICQPGEPVNPILFAKGGEIQVEQFGIIGWLYEMKEKDTGRAFFQCPLIESRESGTGKFGEWLQNVKAFVKQTFDAEFALATITNQHLYKYCEKYDVFVAVDDRLYRVRVGEKKEKMV